MHDHGGAAILAPPIDPTDDCRKAIADISSRRAQIGWSTSGHTGVDVPVHASGYRSEKLVGNMENTDVSVLSFVSLSRRAMNADFCHCECPDWPLHR